MSMASFCIYCGEAVEHAGVGIEEAHRRLLEHDRKCKRNPMTQILRELVADIEAMQSSKQTPEGGWFGPFEEVWGDEVRWPNLSILLKKAKEVIE